MHAEALADAVHAEALADAVRAELGRLANAKITEADAAALVAGAAQLRATESEWVDAQRAATPGNVATARAAFGAFLIERKRGVKKAAATVRRKKTAKKAEKTATG
ncbi:MAG: hypothetical protein JWM10_1863 [Myxococcaceae bacterium]|nr:hypothetical protein [Myxococcaceae bacterium]